MSQSALSPLGAQLRRTDPDRFLTALFAPPAQREALFTLYAFNHELARARAVASVPMLALIRLHWWREVIEGADRRHEIATPLRAALHAGILHAPDLLAMIDAREAEAEESIPDTAAWWGWLRGAHGGVAVAAGRVLGADGATCDRLRALGAAYGAAGVLLGVAASARAGRCLLPEDALADHGTTLHTVTSGQDAPAVAAAIAALRRQALAELAAGQGRYDTALAAALPGVLARRDLRRTALPPARGAGDRLAVLIASIRRRV